MKITADMVGREIIYGGTRRKVIAVADGDLWTEIGGRQRMTISCGERWELAPEPPKRPSQRITEIQSKLEFEGGWRGASDAWRQTEAVTRYLDELREQGKI